MNNNIIITALEKTKELIDSHINFVNDLGDDDYEEYIKILSILIQYECKCDSYNNFDCGCRHRRILYNEAVSEINKVFCYGCEYENLHNDEFHKPSYCNDCVKGSKIKI